MTRSVVNVCHGLRAAPPGDIALGVPGTVCDDGPKAASDADACTRARVQLGGVWFDNVTLREAIRRIDALVRCKRPALVVTPNVDHVVRLQRDRGYANLVRMADLVLADGQPIVWGSRVLGRPLKERVAGSDLFPQLCEHAAAVGYRVFFLGGDSGAAEAAGRVLKQRFPTLQIVGTYCPSQGFETDREECRHAVEAVRTTNPDLLFIGLGSPKQERWAVRHSRTLGPLVAIGVGISFSFVAGHVKRAPAWMRRLGLEWLHRLCMEPRRLWKRYLVSAWRLLPVVWHDILSVYLTRRMPASHRHLHLACDESQGNEPRHSVGWQSP